MNNLVLKSGSRSLAAFARLLSRSIDLTRASNNLVQAAEEMKAATLTLDVGKVIT